MVQSHADWLAISLGLEDVRLIELEALAGVEAALICQGLQSCRDWKGDWTWDRVGRDMSKGEQRSDGERK